MDTKAYWREKHEKYAHQDWIVKPTIFAEFAIKYFPKNGRLLELGAGQGQDSRFFAGKGYKVVSTDFSDEALEIAERKAREKNLNIEFKSVDLLKPLPFHKQSFDIIYSHLALQYFDQERTESLFKEIAEILTKGGILALLLNTSVDPEQLLSKSIEDGLYETPSGLIKRFYTTDYLKQLTEDKFEPMILDNKGETYKDEIKTLIRYIGTKK